MHEPNRRLRPNTRVLTTLLLVFAVVLAGCTGIGGLGGEDDTTDVTPTTSETSGDGGDSGDSNGEPSGDGGDTGASNGNGADTSAGDGTDSAVGDDSQLEDDWFNLSEPGYYEFDLAGMDPETGEQVTGRLVYDAEAAGNDELTVSVDYEFGSEQFQSTTTAPADEISAQLFLNEAYAPIATLQGVSLMYLFEMGFTDPAVGNYKQSTTDEGTQTTKVTETRTYAGLECFFVETTLDGDPIQEGCIRGSEGGIAPYAATYTDEGELELEVELVAFEPR